MKSFHYMLLSLLLTALMIINNLLILKQYPLVSISNIILHLILSIVIVMFYNKCKTERYDPYAYNYDRENPNALISGRVIGGSVYTAYPNNAPGLGWIL
jgi:hypothetical protein